jgi:hypothetical protein
MNYRDQLDPTLKDLLGDEEPDEQSIGGETGADPLDPVGAFLHQLEFGIPAEGATPEPKTITQISKALDNLRADLAESPSEAKTAFFTKMAKSAEEYCPGSFAADFLAGAAENDDARMRRAVKTLVTQHKEEIIAADGSLERLLVIE